MKRLNIITLGVENLERSKSFYEELFGWSPREPQSESIVFYNQGGFLLALFPKEELSKDANVSIEGSGFSGITLAHNAIEKEDVQPFLEKAQSLGGEIVKNAEDVFWGGHSGYFKDLNGHLWEVAYNPFTKTLSNGMLDILVK